MRKVLLAIVLLAMMVLMCGCSNKEAAPKLRLSNPNETVVEETVLWENVLTEEWG